MNDLIEALQILAKYASPDYPTECKHDILIINPSINPDDVSSVDKLKLIGLGFLINVVDDSEKYFFSYAFGSC